MKIPLPFGWQLALERRSLAAVPSPSQSRRSESVRSTAAAGAFVAKRSETVLDEIRRVYVGDLRTRALVALASAPAADVAAVDRALVLDLFDEVEALNGRLAKMDARAVAELRTEISTMQGQLIEAGRQLALEQSQRAAAEVALDRARQETRLAAERIAELSQQLGLG